MGDGELGVEKGSVMCFRSRNGIPGINILDGVTGIVVLLSPVLSLRSRTKFKH